MKFEASKLTLILIKAEFKISEVCNFLIFLMIQRSLFGHEHPIRQCFNSLAKYQGASSNSGNDNRRTKGHFKGRQACDDVDGGDHRGCTLIPSSSSCSRETPPLFISQSYPSLERRVSNEVSFLGGEQEQVYMPSSHKM